MFRRVERGFRAVGDLDPVEDVGEVAGHGAVADMKLLADVPVGVSLGHQGQHLALAPAERVGRFSSGVFGALEMFPTGANLAASDVWPLTV